MFRNLLYIGVLLAFASSCVNEPFRPATGDLLFRIGDTSAMTRAITSATIREGSLPYSHVAIAWRDNGLDKSDSVIEATDGGVRMTSLSDFLAGAAPAGVGRGVVVLRLRDTTGIAGASATRARRWLGFPYDYSYRPDNGRFYCSELVWESFIGPDGKHLFTTRPMNFRDSSGRMPVFWKELFRRLGEPIPEGLPGTNPADLSKDPQLYEVHRYF